VVAGQGADVVAAADGERDVVDGGPGVDRADVDAALDDVERVEHVR
jgi:hypothetical protein